MGRKEKHVMKKFYVIDDLSGISRRRRGFRRDMYYLGYIIGLIEKFAIGFAIGAVVNFMIGFLEAAFAYFFG